MEYYSKKLKGWLTGFKTIDKFLESQNKPEYCAWDILGNGERKIGFEDEGENGYWLYTANYTELPKEERDGRDSYVWDGCYHQIHEDTVRELVTEMRHGITKENEND